MFRHNLTNQWICPGKSALAKYVAIVAATWNQKTCRKAPPTRIGTIHQFVARKHPSIIMYMRHSRFDPSIVGVSHVVHITLSGREGTERGKSGRNHNSTQIKTRPKNPNSAQLKAMNVGRYKNDNRHPAPLHQKQGQSKLPHIPPLSVGEPS